jgi:hypothetical protein
MCDSLVADLSLVAFYSAVALLGLGAISGWGPGSRPFVVHAVASSLSLCMG